MKLSELIETLTRMQSLHPREDPEIVVPTINPSVGPVSVARVYSGFDWDSGRLFFKTEESLCKTAKVTNEQIEERAKEYAENTHERLGFEYPHRRKDCWLAGFYEGSKWGITKLSEAQNNDKE